MEPTDIVGKSKEDASLPKGCAYFNSKLFGVVSFIYILSIFFLCLVSLLFFVVSLPTVFFGGARFSF